MPFYTGQRESGWFGLLPSKSSQILCRRYTYRHYTILLKYTTMLKLIGLLICLWTPQFLFSQSGFPTKIILNTDTFVNVTPAQLDSANVKFTRAREMNAYLLNIIRTDEETFLKSDSANFSLYQSGLYKDSVNNELRSIINLNVKQTKEDNGKLWFVKLERDVFFVAAILFAGRIWIK